MHPQQSTRVPPGGSRFPPEARRVGGVAQRQLSAVQDLIAMQVRDGHLGRRNEEEIVGCRLVRVVGELGDLARALRSEEHTSELQSRLHLVCRLLLEKKKKDIMIVALS